MQPLYLRIDVDTLRGTRSGVPNLLRLLARKRIRATFFFSVGPDNMGRHIWRLMNPAFLGKMLRTGAGRLYGWEVLFRGTVVPGPMIGKRCPGPIREAAESGHEIGLHAWDHHRWQTRIDRMDPYAIHEEVRAGYETLTNIAGKAPDCFAAPAWRITPEALEVLDRFPFRFQSDFRGRSLFFPVSGNSRFRNVQVPVTLPTYDECVGISCTAESYNDHLLKMTKADRLNVLTIHAEVEGIRCLDLFENFLARAEKKDIVFRPLGELAGESPSETVHMDREQISGRQGWVSVQGERTWMSDGCHNTYSRNL